MEGKTRGSNSWAEAIARSCGDADRAPQGMGSTESGCKSQGRVWKGPRPRLTGWIPQTLPLTQQHLLLGKKIINTTNRPEARRPQGSASAPRTEDPPGFPWRFRIGWLLPPLATLLRSRHHKSITEPLPPEPGAPALPTTVPTNPTAKGVALEADFTRPPTTTNPCEITNMWFSAKRLFSVRGTVPSLPCPHSEETEVPWKHLEGFYPLEAGKDSPRQSFSFSWYLTLRQADCLAGLSATRQHS